MSTALESGRPPQDPGSAEARAASAFRTVTTAALRWQSGPCLESPYLAASDFAPKVAAGRLRVINTQPPFPPIQYFAVHRTGAISPLGAIVAGIARDCCDFSVRRF